MLHLDLKYVNILANHFERFTRKGDYLFNVRCPICGDSQAKKTKMRGYIYRVKQNLAYKCHNCNASMGLGPLIKHLNPQLHKEYTLEILKEKRPGLYNLTKLLTEPGFFDSPTPVRFGKVDAVIYQNAERVIDLPEVHYCRQYVKNRRIPKEHWHKLYYTENYKLFVDEVAPGHGKEIRADARLVIPFYDAYGAVIAVSGRSFDTSDRSLRYVTIRTNTDTNKLIYGLERVDQSKPVYVVEGPLDSLFLENAVASGDSNLMLVAKNLSAAKSVLVFDNEPRNKEIIRQMERAIRAGFRVCVWPEWMKEKDINAMVLADYTPAAIQTLIHNNIYQGLTALTHLTFWKKTATTKE